MDERCRECHGSGLVWEPDDPSNLEGIWSCVGYCPRCQGTGLELEPESRKSEDSDGRDS